MTNFIASLLFLFLLIFPKGGIKVGGIPLTWGYLLLTLIGLFSLFRKRFVFSKPRLDVLLCLLPFQLISFFSLFFNGIENLGFTFSFILSFFFLPMIFFFLFSEQIERLELDFVLSWIKWGVFTVAFYGIFLFFFKLLTGSFLEIPFLTVNYDDFGMLEATKCINRGSVFKLISTFNNGNLYGVCILQFYPLYRFLDKSFFRINVVRLSLLLTLSRTVWVGLLVSEFLYFFFVHKGKKIVFLFLIGFCFCLMLFIVEYFSFAKNFLFDTDLGGRIGQFETIKQMNFFSHEPFNNIYEIAYLGILESFGFFGLLSFCFGILSPIFVLFFYKRKNIDPLDRAMICGLISYLILCLADGGMLYIPTMAYFWFISSFLLRMREEKVAVWIMDKV